MMSSKLYFLCSSDATWMTYWHGSHKKWQTQRLPISLETAPEAEELACTLRDVTPWTPTSQWQIIALGTRFTSQSTDIPVISMRRRRHVMRWLAHTHTISESEHRIICATPRCGIIQQYSYPTVAENLAKGMVSISHARPRMCELSDWLRLDTQEDHTGLVALLIDNRVLVLLACYGGGVLFRREVSLNGGAELAPCINRELARTAEYAHLKYACNMDVAATHGYWVADTPPTSALPGIWAPWAHLLHGKSALFRKPRVANETGSGTPTPAHTRGRGAPRAPKWLTQAWFWRRAPRLEAMTRSAALITIFSAATLTVLRQGVPSARASTEAHGVSAFSRPSPEWDKVVHAIQTLTATNWQVYALHMSGSHWPRQLRVYARPVGRPYQPQNAHAQRTRSMGCTIQDTAHMTGDRYALTITCKD